MGISVEGAYGLRFYNNIINLGVCPLNVYLPGFLLVSRHLLTCHLGETSKFTGCSHHIQQPATANLYRKSYMYLLHAAAFGCSQLL